MIFARQVPSWAGSETIRMLTDTSSISVPSRWMRCSRIFCLSPKMSRLSTKRSETVSISRGKSRSQIHIPIEGKCCGTANPLAPYLEGSRSIFSEGYRFTPPSAWGFPIVDSTDTWRSGPFGNPSLFLSTSIPPSLKRSENLTMDDRIRF